MRADPATELWVLHPGRAHDSAPPRSGAIAALAPRAAVDPQPPCRTTPHLPVHLLFFLLFVVAHQCRRHPHGSTQLMAAPAAHPWLPTAQSLPLHPRLCGP